MKCRGYVLSAESRLLLFVILQFSVLSVRAQPHETRLAAGWEFFKGDLGGVWETVRQEAGHAPEDILSWERVILPHCFNAEDAVDPDVRYYQGPAWYRNNIVVNNPIPRGRTILHFQGAGQKTDVYIYLTKVGSHTGGYDEWSVDITEAVDAFKKSELFTSVFQGKIPIAIRCDNSRDVQMIPSSLSDFNLYGGIYRHLELRYRPSLAIEKVLANPEVIPGTNRGRITVATSLINVENVAAAQLEITLTDKNGRMVTHRKAEIDPALKNVWTGDVSKLSLWSPAHPELYTLTASIEANGLRHESTTQIGFRHFEFIKDGPFRLNGARLLLRGTHRHEDHAARGAALTDRMMKEEMVMIKEMGANFIRLGHYQQSDRILELCDSLGILVWEEIPWCRGGLGGEVYKEQARRMLRNMISQHYNHPSVIIWGLGNENDWPGDFPVFDKEKIRAFMKELNDLAHSLDSARKTAIRRCDFCKDVVDVYSPSIWAGWYRGRYTEYREETLRQHKEVDHFLHVEWGGDSHARRHAEEPENIAEHIRIGQGVDERSGDASLIGGNPRFAKDGDWSETYVCNLIDWHLKEQETMPWLTGTAYWPFKDFSTPVRPDNPVPYMNQKGVVERDLTKKESYYVFQSYWSPTPMVHIYGHSWPVRWGRLDEMKMVKVYSNCDQVELFLNGKSLGIRKRDSQDFPAAGLRWMVALTEGRHHFRAVGREKGTLVTDEITQFYQTAPWSKPAQLIVKKIAETNDTITVEAQLVDNQNIQCLDARNWIYFSSVGSGELIDNQGTSSGSRKVQAYNGRAMINMRTKGGTDIVCVQSPGIPTVFLKLEKKSISP